MNRVLLILSGILIFYFTYGFRLSQFEVNVVDSKISNDHPEGIYDYRGAINVHTDLSLGSSNQNSIIQSAKSAGLDFVMFTDLNLFRVNPGFEGYQGSTIALVGSKYSYIDSRILYYSPNHQGLADSLGEAQVRLADGLTQPSKDQKDSLLILAHPNLSGFQWNGDLPNGLDGFEVLNMKQMLDRAWSNSPFSVFFSFLTYPFNPRLSFVRLISDPTDELLEWDRQSAQRHFVGIAGSEASARAIPLPSYLIRFPSYQKIFEFMSNHIQTQSELTGSFLNDRNKIFQAIKNGNLYFSIDSIGDPKGFVCLLKSKGQRHLIGSQIKLTKDTSLLVKLPAEPKYFFEIVVYKNGESWKIMNQSEFEIPIQEPGTYRVTVRVSPFFPLPDAKKWVTWIYANPFYVLK